jgi:hypothetical protein
MPAYVRRHRPRRSLCEHSSGLRTSHRQLLIFRRDPCTAGLPGRGALAEPVTRKGAKNNLDNPFSRYTMSDNWRREASLADQNADARSQGVLIGFTEHTIVDETLIAGASTALSVFRAPGANG